MLHFCNTKKRPISFNNQQATRSASHITPIMNRTIILFVPGRLASQQSDARRRPNSRRAGTLTRSGGVRYGRCVSAFQRNAERKALALGNHYHSVSTDRREGCRISATPIHAFLLGKLF